MRFGIFVIALLMGLCVYPDVSDAGPGHARRQARRAGRHDARHARQAARHEGRAAARGMRSGMMGSGW